MRQPCYDCTLKHLTKAKSYSDDYDESGNSFHFMNVVGNLGQAEDEILGYDVNIAMTIRDFRLQYMDEKKGDWNKLLGDYFLVWDGDHKEPEYMTAALSYDGGRYRSKSDALFIRTCEAIVILMEASLGYPEYIMDVIGILERITDLSVELKFLEVENQAHALIKEMITDPSYPYDPECIQDLRILGEAIMVERV